MRLKLTPQEQKDLVFREGDFFDVVPGTITFTTKHQVTDPIRKELTTLDAKFFFESATDEWGVQEWDMQIGSEVPNGPALLVIYRRGDDGNAFGIVSMGNRAWTHAQPLGHLDLYRKSPTYSRLRGKEWLVLAAMILWIWFTVRFCCYGIFLLPLCLYFPPLRKRLSGLLGVTKGEETTAAARGLMFRIAKNADRYWPNPEGGSGKL